jgi:hypothetical protein
MPHRAGMFHDFCEDGAKAPDDGARGNRNP